VLHVADGSKSRESGCVVALLKGVGLTIDLNDFANATARARQKLCEIDLTGGGANAAAYTYASATGSYRPYYTSAFSSSHDV
jgi:hypothetical protein